MVTSSETDLQEKIQAQVEYYFGDINLRKDKFIRYHSKMNDGWFPIEKLMTFNKLKALTTDAAQVVEAVKSSELVELSEDNNKIRRLKPMPELTEEEKKLFNLRTIHLKGFPKEATFEEIKQFCDAFGKVDFVQMRRFPKDKKFKGCIMVTFEKLEDAEKVVSGEPVKYNEVELLRETKEKYHERKEQWLSKIKEKAKVQEEAALVSTKGAILKLVGLNKDTKFTDIKDELTKYSPVAFVGHVTDDGECLVRFNNEGGAAVAFKSLKGEEANDSEKKEDEKENEVKEGGDEKEAENLAVDFLKQSVVFSLVSGEEEIQFWREFKNRQKNQNYKRKPWQNKKKHRNEDGGNTNSTKKQKVDA